ncbi:MAG TPA: hypothetical protein VLR92_06880, partial [Blastocatellia bacterium]|nr:hypothetical protein [Blastocatellia bacterium]
MTDVDVTYAFPTVVIGDSASGALLLDSNILINFDRIGSLDTLLAAHRTILITPEVFREVVTNGLASSNPNVVASASRISSWIQLHPGDVQVVQSDPNRSIFTGPGPGEASVLADAAYLGGHGTDVVILSDDSASIALKSAAGSNFPVLTGNYFLNSLLLGGAITPTDYFRETTAGLTNGFNQGTLGSNLSSIFANGTVYQLKVGGVLRGSFQYTTTGSSSITYDGQTILFAPYEKGGIQNGVPFKTSDASDDGTQLGYLDSPERSEYTALFTNFLTKASLNYSDPGSSPSDEGIALVAPSGNVDVDIKGGSDPQQISASDGTNLLAGGTGNDQIQASGGVNFLAGGDGNDAFLLGSAATDWIEGDSGRDIANYSLDPLGGLTATIAAANGRAGGDQIVAVAGNGVNDQVNSVEQINFFGQDNAAVVEAVSDHQSIASDVTLNLGATLYSSNETLDFSQYTGSVDLSDRKNSDGAKGVELFLDKNFTNTSHYSFQNFNTLNLGAGDD